MTNSIIYLSTVLLIFYSFNGYSQNAALDLSFDFDGIASPDFQGGDDEARSAVVQPDGKIVVAGSSFNGSNHDLSVVRYNTDGSLDNSFGTGGKVITLIPNGNTYGYSVAIQSDGKIVVAGHNSYNNVSKIVVVRYNIDGTLDNSFDNDGIVTTTTTFGIAREAVAIQLDGKIVVVSGFGSIAVFRYNTDGSLDTTFDLDGVRSYSYYTANFGSNVQIQTDGKILVSGGYFSHIAASSNFWGALLLRFNTNGSLDATFGSGGVLSFSGPENYYGLALQSNGKIIATGELTSNWGTTRHNTNGSMDINFQQVNFAGNYSVSFSTAVQSDGKVLVVGRIENSSILVRYDTTGMIDSSFNGIGHVALPNAPYTFVTIQSDGKIIVVGTKYSAMSDKDFGVYRFNTDGSLDTTFDNDGMVNTDLGKSSFITCAMAQQADGKLVCLVAKPEYLASFLCRYAIDGSLDNTFGNNGRILMPLKIGNFVEKEINSNQYINNDNGDRSIAIQADGKIVVVGYKDIAGIKDAAVVRYNIDGTLDNTFGNNGIADSDLGLYDNFGNAIAVQPDGKLVVTGSTKPGGLHQLTTVRYNANGSLDTTFSGDGIVITDISAYNDIGRSIVVQLDGKILVGGYSYTNLTNYDFALVRYNTDGTLDTTFNGTGTLTTALNNNDFLYSIALQSDGKIVAVGTTGSASQWDFAVVRYNTNGSLDNTFNGNGKLILPIESKKDIARSVALDSMGKIIITGSSTTNSNTNISLVRLNTNGSLDSSFYADGIVINDFGQDNAYALLIQSDGKLVVAGSIQYNANSYVNSVVIRLLDAYTGIQQVDAVNLKLKVYPNPTKDNITIELDALYADLEYQLFNQLGQVVGYGNINSATTTIDLESLHSGVYFLTIGGAASGVVKIIKE